MAVRHRDGFGYFLVALTAYSAGETLHRFGIRESLPAATYLSVQIGPRQHVHLAPRLLQYINHSCDPNVFFDPELSCVICLRDIQAGEEIVFFYPSTEWTMSRPFACQCGAPACLGFIQGAAHVPAEVLSRYRLAPHISQMLERGGAAGLVVGEVVGVGAPD